MISVNKAREILSAHLKKTGLDTVPLKKSLGSILAKDLYSPIDVPSFDNSAKDGYVIKYNKKLEKFNLKGEIQAGDVSTYKLTETQAARIFTGAKMPENSDTVVPQEIVAIDENNRRISFPQEKININNNVRYKGSQCKKGDLIVKQGTEISPGIIGLLASVGIAEIPVFSTPSVAYIITGNELKEIGTDLKAGEIYDSNGPMLEAMLEKTGISVITSYTAEDDKNALQEVINRALEENEVLLLSGGISVGDYDFVEECLKTAGVKELFYKVKQRPGKPFYAGKKGEKWIFALPGNPASVFSCFNQFVKPCLRFLMGYQEVWKPNIMLPLQEDQRKKSGLTFFLKAKKEHGKVSVLSGQQSFNLQAFHQANCLVELAEENDMVKAGTPVKIYDI